MQINPIDEHRAAVEVKFHCKKKTKKRRRSRENRKRLEARGSHIERERTAHFRHLQPSTDRLSPSCGQLALHLDETGGWLSATCDPEKKVRSALLSKVGGFFLFFSNSSVQPLCTRLARGARFQQCLPLPPTFSSSEKLEENSKWRQQQILCVCVWVVSPPCNVDTVFVEQWSLLCNTRGRH